MGSIIQLIQERIVVHIVESQEQLNIQLTIPDNIVGHTTHNLQEVIVVHILGSQEQHNTLISLLVQV